MGIIGFTLANGRLMPSAFIALIFSCFVFCGVGFEFEEHIPIVRYGFEELLFYFQVMISGLFLFEKALDFVLNNS